METLISLAAGLGLSAACGFRVFVPLFGIGLATRAGYLAVSPGFEWLGTDPALIAFGAATVLEVLAYNIPWMDNLLDTLATPAALLAGVVASAAVFVDLPPMLRWTAAVIGGGAAAGVVQWATVILRLKSTAFTGGLANPAVAAAETGASALTVVLAIVVPVVCLVAVGAVCLAVFRLSVRRQGGAPPTASPRRGP